jgi:hypothetical protein
MFFKGSLPQDFNKILEPILKAFLALHASSNLRTWLIVGSQGKRHTSGCYVQLFGRKICMKEATLQT